MLRLFAADEIPVEHGGPLDGEPVHGPLDLNSGTLTVRQMLEDTKEGLRFKEPKTERGCRTIVHRATGRPQRPSVPVAARSGEPPGPGVPGVSLRAGPGPACRDRGSTLQRVNGPVVTPAMVIPMEVRPIVSRKNARSRKAREVRHSASAA